jgi:hypothetical protein
VSEQTSNERDEAFDHAVSALGKADGFMLVSYRMEGSGAVFSVAASSMADQAFLTKVAETYLSAEMMAMLGGAGSADYERDDEEQEEED